MRIQATINKQQERFDKAQVELGRLKAQSAAAKEEHECAVRALPGASGPAGAVANSLDATQAIALALGPNVRSEVLDMPELRLLLNELRQAYAGKCAGIELIEKADAERREAAAAASQAGLPQAEPGVDITLLDASDDSTGPDLPAAPPKPTLPSTPAPAPFKLPVDQALLETMFAGKEITTWVQIAEQVNSLSEAHALQPPPPPNKLGEDRFNGGGTQNLKAFLLRTSALAVCAQEVKRLTQDDDMWTSSRSGPTLWAGTRSSPGRSAARMVALAPVLPSSQGSNSACASPTPARGRSAEEELSQGSSSCQTCHRCSWSLPTS